MRLSEDKRSVVHDILVALDKLRSAADGSPVLEDIQEPLALFSAQCKLSVAHRVLANNHGGYAVLLKLLKNVQGEPAMLGPTLKAMVALTESNPDILTTEGTQVMVQLMEEWKCRADNLTIPEYLARWCIESCVKHERNRQTLVAAGSLGALVALLHANKSNSRVVRSTCKALRAHTLDDDIRQEFGKAHEHARILVEEHGLIGVCLDMIKDWHHESETSSELLYVVGKLCVRAEYCQQAVDHGALCVINDVLTSFPNHAILNKQAISLLKAMVGNDEVKREAMKSGVGQLVIMSMTNHMAIPSVCEEGCGALSMMSLRVPDYSKQLVQAGAGQAVVQAMKTHPKNKQLQKLGCMAIRNMASRVQDNQHLFVEYGVEEVIQAALQNHGEAVKDVAKAALRDLDLKVDFVEQWRGTGHEIHR
nr:armadillo repeat-containing protein 6-like isoform X2 [Procambarus clarkii]